MDSQRLFLYIALVLVLFLLGQRWAEYVDAKNPRPVASQPAAPEAQVASNEDVVPSVAPVDTPTAQEQADTAVPSLAAPDAPTGEAEPSTTDLGDGKVLVSTDLIDVEIATKGGVITRLATKKHPVSVDDKDTPFELLTVHNTNSGQTEMLVAQTGLVKYGTDREYPNHFTDYQAEQTEYSLDDGQDEIKVPLTWQSEDGIVYQKVFTFRRDSYLIDIDHVVDNQSDSLWQGLQYAQFMSTDVAESQTSWLFGGVASFEGAAMYTPENQYQKVSYSDIAEGEVLPRDGGVKGGIDAPSGWVGMLQHYFVAVYITGNQGLETPEQAPDAYRLYSRYQSRANNPLYYAGMRTLQPTQVAPGEKGSLPVSLFAGPKEQSRLSEIPADGLLLSVDFGWLTFLAQPLFWVLNALHGIFGNWGWAIIFLTVLIKAAFYPLSAASYRSMAKMKKLGPRLQTLKERYGDDRAKLNAEMMQMYKKEKINPLGGCLPILVQIPVFIALYWVLLESVELRQAPFMGWIRDLSIMDPYYVLPITMGATMFGQHFLNPQPMDPIQKNVMLAMPVFFTFIFLWFPAGLVLYWLVNNVLSISQQWYITRKIV